MKHYPSFWESSVLLRPFDFLILGAGLIGKQIALRLKEKYPAARIAIVDRSPISYGASTRNAGFACFGSLTELLDDLSHTDASIVAEVTRKRYQGIQMLVEEFGAENIHFRATGAYEVFETEKDFNEAVDKMDEINRFLKDAAAIPEAFQIADLQSSRMNCYQKGVLNPHEGMINSGHLNEVINERVHRAVIIPLYGLNVQSIEKGSPTNLLRTEEGLELKALNLIVATNAFSSLLMPELDVKPARGQILVTNEMKDIPFDGVFHADQGYIYFRNLENRVLIGGGRNHFRQEEETYNFEGSEQVRQYLINYLRTVVLPGLEFEIEAHWSGIMAMGTVKQPIVQLKETNLALCVRMSGIGVAIGPVLSREVAAFF